MSRISVSAGHDAVAFAGVDQDPNGPCHAGGEGDCDQLHRLALQHLPQPIFTGGFVAARGNLGKCPKIEQALELPLSATDGVDGSCSRRRDAPLWGCRLTPSQGAIHARDYHHRP